MKSCFSRKHWELLAKNLKMIFIYPTCCPWATIFGNKTGCAATTIGLGNLPACWLLIAFWLGPKTGHVK